ncbi:MAG: MFS transporter [Hyphomicrobiales bacterium]|nr:MAG: MFS transporter [Hyphomicrobiales bacterium]
MTRNKSIALILVLWTAGLGAAAQFAKISLIFPDLQNYYADAGSALGFMVSLLSFLGIVLGLFAGMLVARLGFRKLLLFALLLGAAVSLYQASLPPLPLMLGSRVLEGVSHLIIVVAAPTLIAQISPDRLRPFAMTLWGTFFGVAFTIVAWFGLPMIEIHGIASLFYAHALWLIGAAIVLYFMLPALNRGKGERPSLALSEIIRRHVESYRSPFISAPALGWLFYALTFVALLTILPGYLDPQDRAFVSGAMPIASIIASMSLGALLLRYTSAINIVLLGFALSGVMMIVLLLTGATPWSCILLFAALGLVQGASFAAIPQLNNKPQAQALTNGAMAQMGNLGNMCGTPLLLFLVSQFSFPGLVFFALTAYIGGFILHMFLQRKRR